MLEKLIVLLKLQTEKSFCRYLICCKYLLSVYLCSLHVFIIGFIFFNFAAQSGKILLQQLCLFHFQNVTLQHVHTRKGKFQNY